MDLSDLKNFDAVISKSYGISFEENNYRFLRDKVLGRMAVNHILDPLEYLDLIKNNKKEITVLVDSLTIHLTTFFRVSKHFQFLRESFLPKIKKENSNKKLRIWSAGCSNGAEAYSIAMEVLNFFGGERFSWDINILASDISFHTLLFAKEGVYSNKLIRDIPMNFREKYLIPGECEFSIMDDVKNYITWDYHNLLYDNGYSNFDIIFCRNVLYYFSQSAKKTVIEKFHQKLKKDAPLLLGSSEYLTLDIKHLFESTKTNENIYFYKKIG